MARFAASGIPEEEGVLMFTGFSILLWIIGLTFLAGCYLYAVAFCTAPYISDDHPDALTSLDMKERGL